jgi:hypothetical protein
MQSGSKRCRSQHDFCDLLPTLQGYRLPWLLIIRVALGLVAAVSCSYYLIVKRASFRFGAHLTSIIILQRRSRSFVQFSYPAPSPASNLPCLYLGSLGPTRLHPSCRSFTRSRSAFIQPAHQCSFRASSDGRRCLIWYILRSNLNLPEPLVSRPVPDS